ncbi:MAG: TMEM165/GDT1 family protein [Actinobacteria bacterium]|nr:TMEM165/GDT1 family protein [Actinomycetota bacterium]
MGDKTQLLTLSFATRYRPWKVLIGITLGTLVVHFASVIAGIYLGILIPLYYIRLAVGVSFVAFGLWTLRGDRLAEKGESGLKLGQVITVAIAFFLAELGDKTQLATIALAAKYESFVGVWIGSTLGMVVADGLAIILGVFAGKRLPERAIKYTSAAIFIIYGAYVMVEALR